MSPLPEYQRISISMCSTSPRISARRTSVSSALLSASFAPM